MKLKLDEAGHVVVSDGKPVYVDDAGKDIAFDAPATIATISRLNAEAKGHREGKEAAESKLKAFEGLDPATAREALDKLGSIDAKKLIDAGEVDKVRAEAIKAVEEKYAPIVHERDALKSELYSEKIGGSFARSKFIADKVAVPVDMIQAAFGSRFSIDGGRIVAKDAAGNQIYSKSRPGEPADFDEALEIMVDSYAHRDSILKGDGHTGSGARGAVQAKGGAKTLTRSAFDALPPQDRMAKMRDGYTLTDG